MSGRVPSHVVRRGKALPYRLWLARYANFKGMGSLIERDHPGADGKRGGRKVRRFRHPTDAPFRGVAKDWVERLLVATVIPGVVRWGRGLKRLVLAYHNVVPPGETVVGDRSLHLPFDRFIDHLDVLQHVAEVLSLKGLVSSSGQAERPQVAVTFDDAYAGALETAIPELARRGLPSTVFVAPDYLDGGVFWWDALASERGLDIRVREQCLNELNGQQHLIRPWARQESVAWHEPPRHARCASTAAIEQGLRDSAGLSVGSHTWSHPNLGRLTREAAQDEMDRSRQWVHDRGGLDIIAYPYGIPPRDAKDLVGESGYAAGFRVDGGHVLAGHNEIWNYPRLNVPAGLSPAGLELWLHGIRSG